MINCYIKKGNKLFVVEGVDSLDNIENKNDVIWIDMLLPILDEVKAIENLFDMTVSSTITICAKEEGPHRVEIKSTPTHPKHRNEGGMQGGGAREGWKDPSNHIIDQVTCSGGTNDRRYYYC